MSDLFQIVHQTAARRNVMDAVQAVYADVAAEIAARQPVCDLSGRCCKFEAYGHRLYVSTLELAAFVAGEGEKKDEGGRIKDEKGESASPRPFSSLSLLPSALSSGCPFQKGKLCTVHSRRPFGCRMFFCDPTADQWQADAYERFHHRLKQLHEQFDVPYAYVEWRTALAQIGLAQAPATV